MKLDAKIPLGPLPQKWDKHKTAIKLVNPSNKRKYEIIVVGTGLAGASAAASLAELGYIVKSFCIQDSPRRAHSVAAQGGINAAKNYQNDGDSVYRLFYDTIKGGDFRSREANVHRLAEVSVNIIDQCVAQGVPFAREYSGYLTNRSFGGAQVSRTFYARGQTGQQLLLGAYQALMRQVALGQVTLFPRTEMLELVVVNGHAKGIVVRDMVTGAISSHSADAVVLATGGYGNTYYLSTYGRGSNATAIWRAHEKGALFANPCFTQIHPTCIPVSGDYQSKLTLMSESLRNDGRVWVPKKKGDKRVPAEIPEDERDYYLERKYPSYGNLAPRDISSRAAKQVCDEGRGVGESGLGVYLDFSDAIKRLGRATIEERYGNLFDMYHEITHENAYQTPMRIFPVIARHDGRVVGRLQSDEQSAGVIRHRRGEFLRPRREPLGASALMQGLGRRLFRAPLYHRELSGQPRSPCSDRSLTRANSSKPNRNSPTRIKKLLSTARQENDKRNSTRSLAGFCGTHCGMTRNRKSLKEALTLIPPVREQFEERQRAGEGEELNQSLERAGRVADYLELAELIVYDALMRDESCGCHFREEHQTPDGECPAQRRAVCLCRRVGIHRPSARRLS